MNLGQQPKTLEEEIAELRASDKVDADLAALKASGDHLLSLVGDVLDLARLEAGTLVLNPAPARIDDLMQSVAELLSPPRLSDTGLFDAQAVGKLMAKCAQGRAIGFGDNMAFVGVLSTMLLHDQFIRPQPQAS